MELYVNASRDKWEKKSRVDHVLFDSFIPCITDYDIEK